MGRPLLPIIAFALALAPAGNQGPTFSRAESGKNYRALAPGVDRTFSCDQKRGVRPEPFTENGVSFQIFGNLTVMAILAIYD